MSSCGDDFKKSEIFEILGARRGVSPQKKGQGCFKNVSMKFCFAILFLHGSHHSYPSRRSTCYCKISQYYQNNDVCKQLELKILKFGQADIFEKNPQKLFRDFFLNI